MAVTWVKVAYSSECILNTVLDVEGDLLHRNVAGVPDGLAISTDGKVLTIALESGVGTEVPVWATPAVAAAHAASHHSDSLVDPLYLSDLTAAGNVAFLGEEAKDLVVYNKDGIPATPVVGKWYYETTTVPGLYVCTSAA